MSNAKVQWHNDIHNILNLLGLNQNCVSKLISAGYEHFTVYYVYIKGDFRSLLAALFQLFWLPKVMYNNLFNSVNI